MLIALQGIILLYLVALHCSMAGMEIFGWLNFLVVVGYKIYRKDHFKFWLWKPLLGLVICVFASMVATPLYKSFWFQFGHMRWILMFWGLAWSLEILWDNKFERMLIWVWGVALSASAIYASFQCLTGIDLLRPGRGVVVPRGNVFKATSFFSMSLTFAYSVGMSGLAIFRTAYLNGLKRWGTWLGLTGLLGVLTAFSRGGWIALFVALIIFVLVEHPKLLLPFLLASGGLVAGLVIWSPGFSDKIMGLLTLQVDHSESVRFDLWQAYWRMFLDHPWFGVGIFEGDVLLPEYYARLGIDQTFTSHAHDVPLQWLAGAGVFSLLFYLWFIFSLGKMAWKTRTSSIWGWGLLISQIYLQIGGLTEANFFDGEVNHMAMFIFAITVIQFDRVNKIPSSPQRRAT